MSYRDDVHRGESITEILSKSCRQRQEWKNIRRDVIENNANNKRLEKIILILCPKVMIKASITTYSQYLVHLSNSTFFLGAATDVLLVNIYQIRVARVGPRTAQEALS